MRSIYNKKLKNFLIEKAKVTDNNFIVADQNIKNIISKEWLDFISYQSNKGLIPLFITGTGVSHDATLSENKNGDLRYKNVPTINNIIDNLKELLKNDNSNTLKEVEDLVDEWKNLPENRKKDRTLVSRIFASLQNTKDKKRRDIWKQSNEKLLNTIIAAQPTEFHKKLAILYNKLNAICLTLNFDGLLVKELKTNGLKAFSLPTKEECENFFLRLGKRQEYNGKNEYKEFAEIQLRGDILYLKCDTEGFCPQKDRPPIPFINPTDNNHDLKNILKCPSCGDKMTPFLSFPGSYEKEKEMKEMLEKVWKYLAYRISSVTLVGVSGDWDPLIIAFLGDLLSERDIPLLIIEKENKITPVIRELIVPRLHIALAIEKKANEIFSENDLLSLKSGYNDYKINGNRDSNFTDYHWDKEGIIKGDNLYKELNGCEINERGFKVNELEKQLLNQISHLESSAQLGLKTGWFGIPVKKEHHYRYYHSIGVMKIAAYIYDKAVPIDLQKDSEKQFLRIGALLHDIGHLPFSHLIEEVFNELNWTPGYYQTSYSHVLQTNKKIKEIFSDNEHYFENQLNKIGYDSDDLIRLINGNFGVGYLDAIINGPVDADKIDYIFADTDATKRKITLSDEQFLKDIVNGLSITPEKLLSFSGVSAKAAYDLLKARMHLYHNLYLLPSVRILESITKQIITSYFVNELDFNNKVENRKIWEQIFKEDDENHPDMGYFKILFCVKQIENLLSNRANDVVAELNVLEQMNKKLKTNNLLNYKYKNSLINGYKLISDIKGETELKELETKIKIYSFERDDSLEKINKIAKTCKLRMPGALIIDVVKTPKFLSVADERKEKLRSDDTKIFSECMVVPSGKCQTWYASQDANIAFLDSGMKDEEARGFDVYVYPLSALENDPYEDPSVKQAMNLFNRLMQQENITFETE
ncbi:MAG: HD domain-containing protein [Ignavibacteriaceae bacterium]